MTREEIEKLIRHSLAYTAQEIAASAHIAGKEPAKTVIVKIDDKMAIAVLPASHKVNFDRLKKTAGASKVQLASEREFRDMFPESEVGAMPPFGNLYGMEVFVGIIGQILRSEKRSSKRQMLCWKSRQKLPHISTNRSRLTRYSPSLNLASRMSNESVTA
jgi:hypothetical protein